MLRQLKKYELPNGVTVTGPFVKGEVIGAIARADALIQSAEQQAEKIRLTIENEVLQARQQAMEEARQALFAEVKAIELVVNNSLKALYQQSVQMCLGICEIALERFIKTADDQTRLRVLIESLLDQGFSAREVSLAANPGQLACLQDLIKEHAQSLGLAANWHVYANDEIDIDKLQINATEGASIEVSISHLLSTLKIEVSALAEELPEPTMEKSE